MGNISNKQKTEQLGMPFGTASGRLKKQVMFELVKRCGLDICYRCKSRIEDHEDLTIEHKEPWFNKSVDLFWDLNNISFSHSKCNIPHKFHGRISKRKRSDGFWLCLDCKKYLSEEEFSLYVTGTPRNWCKICRAKRKNNNDPI